MPGHRSTTHAAALAVLGLAGCEHLPAEPASGLDATADADAAQSPEFVDDGVPADLLSFFPGPTCPDGWKPVPAARGRALMFAASPDRIGRTVLPPLLDGERPHAHPQATVTMSPEKSYFTGFNGCDNNAPFSAAPITASILVEPSTANLPFVYQTLCQKRAASRVDALPYASYGMFDADVCPRGWEPLADCDTCPPVGGRFVVPLGNSGTVGQTVGAAWTRDHSGANHRHEIDSNFKPDDAGLIAVTGTNYRAARGTLSYAGTTAVDPEPPRIVPSIEYLGCIKTSSGPAEKNLPEGMSIFYGGHSDCPERWRPAVESAGRLLVAAPSPDQVGRQFGGPPLGPGEDRTHTHQFKATVSLPGDNVCLAGGDWPIAKSGAYAVSGTSKPAAVGLPYVQLRHCTYTRKETP
ncbi:MAG TPA: hypothetical protein VK034_20810 [Enhygromyxa sp.]|nr:hypothetical protein [Enhygromyxa sp.]